MGIKPPTSCIESREGNHYTTSPYKRNVDEMKIYEEKHKKRFQSIDQQMNEKILGLSSNRLATQEAQNLWLKDTAEQEARSIQLWNKKERFLRRKKHDDEETTPSSAVPTSYLLGNQLLFKLIRRRELLAEAERTLTRHHHGNGTKHNSLAAV